MNGIHALAEPLDRFDRLEVIRSIATELSPAEIEDRRRLALERLAYPNDLIARMKRDWPDQTKAVRRLADRLDISLGEAWARTIAAGVNAIRKGRA